MPRKSYDTVKIKSLNRDKVLRRLKHIDEDMDSKVIELNLFGSLARGNYTEGRFKEIYR